MMLPDEIVEELKKFRKNHWDTFKSMFSEEMSIEDLSPLEVISILSLCDGIVIKTNKFKQGDYIASGRAIDHGLLLIFQANESDVEDYSDKDRIYYIFPKLKNLY